MGRPGERRSPRGLAPLGAGLRPGPTNTITDVEGIEVGHRTADAPPYCTGTTVVLARRGAVGGAAVRGGAPATRETDLLCPQRLVDQVHAVVLTGGSAYGLDSAGGVMRYLEERSIGWRVGTGREEVVPIVPAAALFDLGRGGSFAARPDLGFGYGAAAGATSGAVQLGSVGAGTGALTGAAVGLRLKGGVGSASLALPGGGHLGALVAVNAVGSAVDPESGRFYGEPWLFEDEVQGLGAPAEHELAAARSAVPPGRAGAGGKGPEGAPPGWRAESTVIGVVATDAPLTKVEASRLASVAHDGLARAVVPAHTIFDGDTLFALATASKPFPLLGAPDPLGGAEPPGAPGPPTGVATPASPAARAASLAVLSELAAGCVARAVVHALLAATPGAGAPSYRSAFPSAQRT